MGISTLNFSELARGYRRELFEKFLEIGQGHPGSTFSMIDIVTTLYHGGFVNLDSDKVIVSKGHATVALYPILTKLGVLDPKEWLSWGRADSCLRVFGNINIPGIDVTSGSLGHGVGIGAGMALSAKRSQADRSVYVIVSEGELYEGSTWEALLFASHNKLDNLTIIVDINSLIILGDTDSCMQLNPIGKKLEGFGYEILEIDGHETTQIFDALASRSACPKIILAKTIKGKGFSVMENKANWHYWNPLTPEEISQCRLEIA